MNYTVLVGRIVNAPELKELDNGKKYCNINLAVQQTWTNDEGKYDTDYINCKLLGGTAERVCEYCHKDDIIGVKGRLATNIYEKESDTKELQYYVVAERVTFLSSKSKEINNNLENQNKDDSEMEM